MTGGKPKLDEVLLYAEDQIRFYLQKYAGDAPDEQQEEMEQEARLRVCLAYEQLEGDKGWKTFVQRHIFGAIQDYLRRGRGFEETKWSLADERDGSEPMRFREDGPPDAEEMDIDRLIGLSRRDQDVAEPEAVEEEIELSVRWDLLGRLCSKDVDLHIFVRHHLLGQTLTELTALFGVTRERLGQRLQAFVALFDDPKEIENPWMNQIIYALDLCKVFDMPEVDQGVGWFLEPVNFTRVDRAKVKKRADQLSLFDLTKDLQ